MNDNMYLKQYANEMLYQTSRTFYIPISQLPSILWETVTSAYLCMRAIDEIEDHMTLPTEDKTFLLESIHKIFQCIDINIIEQELDALFLPYKSQLPEVTLQLFRWVSLAPTSIAPVILSTTSIMSSGMSSWVAKQWSIQTKEDLDEYTYFVAGLVGLLLSDIWKWYDGIETDRELAISFGRGLQAVNMLRNRSEDLERGADFYPIGWNREHMIQYAMVNLRFAAEYIRSVPFGPIYNFCKIPHTLAVATLEAIASGKTKLDRSYVNQLVSPFIK